MTSRHPRMPAWLRRPTLIALAAALAACAPAAQYADGASDDDAAPVEATKERVFESAGCDAGEPCARVLHRYPRFDTDSKVGSALHAWTVTQLRQHAQGVGGEADTPDAAARAFLDSFEAFRERTPEAAGEWFDEHQVEVLHRSDHVISLAHSRGWYTGGAHPNSIRHLASFDARTGERLELNDTLRDGVEERLRDLLTRALRRKRDLDRELSLEDAGYFTRDRMMPLNDNFAVVADGWLFRWDPYEIAPYAMGPTEITLGWREIANLVRRGSPAAPPDPPKVAEDEEDG